MLYKNNSKLIGFLFNGIGLKTISKFNSNKCPKKQLKYGCQRSAEPTIVNNVFPEVNCEEWYMKSMN